MAETNEMMELTENQITYFEKYGLKVPRIISTSLLGFAEALVLELLPSNKFYIEVRNDLHIFDFDDVTGRKKSRKPISPRK